MLQIFLLCGLNFVFFINLFILFLSENFILKSICLAISFSFYAVLFFKYLKLKNVIQKNNDYFEKKSLEILLSNLLRAFTHDLNNPIAAMDILSLRFEKFVIKNTITLEQRNDFAMKLRPISIRIRESVSHFSKILRSSKEEELFKPKDLIESILNIHSHNFIKENIVTEIIFPKNDIYIKGIPFDFNLIFGTILQISVTSRFQKNLEKKTLKIILEENNGKVTVSIESNSLSLILNNNSEYDPFVDFINKKIISSNKNYKLDNTQSPKWKLYFLAGQREENNYVDISSLIRL